MQSAYTVIKGTVNYILYKEDAFNSLCNISQIVGLCYLLQTAISDLV